MHIRTSPVRYFNCWYYYMRQFAQLQLSALVLSHLGGHSPLHHSVGQSVTQWYRISNMTRNKEV